MERDPVQVRRVTNHGLNSNQGKSLKGPPHLFGVRKETA
jgi:hypothetical protein